MANIAASWTQVHPSYMMPEIVLPYTQASGAFRTLWKGEPQVRLGEGDLYVYGKRADIRNRVQAGQSSATQLPSVTVVLSQFSAPTYLQQVRAEYDHHDTAAVGKWGIALPEAQRLGMRQGHFQLSRTALLQGFNPINGEGLLYAQGATAVSLPPDSFGNDTVVTYDAGEMAFFLNQQFALMKNRTNQLGIPEEFVILGPQRTLGSFEYDVVQLTQFQRTGAGTTSTAGVVKAVLMDNGDKVFWCYDDTLIGKGAGGTDAVLLVMPSVEKPEGSEFNTNEFATLEPGLEACTLMLCDMAAPREIPTPMPGGAVDVLSEMRVTPGWPIRPEAITIISMTYE